MEELRWNGRWMSLQREDMSELLTCVSPALTGPRRLSRQYAHARTPHACRHAPRAHTHRYTRAELNSPLVGLRGDSPQAHVRGYVCMRTGYGALVARTLVLVLSFAFR